MDLNTNGTFKHEIEDASSKVVAWVNSLTDKAFADAFLTRTGIKSSKISAWRKPKTYIIAAGIVASFGAITRALFGYKKPKF